MTSSTATGEKKKKRIRFYLFIIYYYFFFLVRKIMFLFDEHASLLNCFRVRFMPSWWKKKVTRGRQTHHTIIILQVVHVDL